MKLALTKPVVFAIKTLAIFLPIIVMPKEASAQEYLFFSSDIHNQKSTLLTRVGEACGNPNKCELIGLVGDYNLQDPSVMYSTADDLSNIALNVYITLNWQTNGMNFVTTQGNHDTENEFFVAGGYFTSGPVMIENNTNYDVYRINVSDFASICSNLTSYLSTVTSKMLMVMSHYPLHSNRDGIDQNGANCIFTALQNAAARGQDITFLWGHNHYRSGRPDYDANVRMVAAPGQTIQSIAGNTYNNANANQALKFSYVNAGYSITGAAALIALTSTSMTITRYSTGASPVPTTISR
jgi:hypothetical protein